MPRSFCDGAPFSPLRSDLPRTARLGRSSFENANVRAPAVGMEDPVPCSPLQAVSPFGGLSGAGAADILSGLAAAAVPWRGGGFDEPDQCADLH